MTPKPTKTKDRTAAADIKGSAPIGSAPAAIVKAGNLSPSTKKAKNKKPTASNHQPAKEPRSTKPKSSQLYDECVELFDDWDEREFVPDDYTIDVETDSLESRIGYGSLFRQMHQAFLRRVAFYRSPKGGSMSLEEARGLAFHACKDDEAVRDTFRELMGTSLETLHFVDLMEMHTKAPRVAERFWEMVKLEARQEFESGHLAANILFPAGYMRSPWNIARYLGVRESFIDEWGPRGGVEIALVDMLAQSYFQWQYWLEQNIKRSQTPERTQDPEYEKWQARQRELNPKNRLRERDEGEWWRPYMSDKTAIEHAAQEAERWHRTFMRTLRQLRDLRRYTPVMINNANQVNIAGDGGQQINVNKNG
jgi:hypothetical protein